MVIVFIVPIYRILIKTQLIYIRIKCDITFVGPVNYLNMESTYVLHNYVCMYQLTLKIYITCNYIHTYVPTTETPACIFSRPLNTLQLYTTNVTGFWKTDHFVTFDIIDNSVYLRHSKWYHWINNC